MCVSYGHPPTTQWKFQTLYDKLGSVVRQLFRNYLKPVLIWSNSEWSVLVKRELELKRKWNNEINPNICLLKRFIKKWQFTSSLPYKCPMYLGLNIVFLFWFVMFGFLKLIMERGQMETVHVSINSLQDLLQLIANIQSIILDRINPKF